METTDKWNKLQAELDSYGEQAPEGLWYGISGGLRRNRRRRAFRWAAGASAAFAAAAAALILTVSPGSDAEVELLRQEPHARLAEADVRPESSDRIGAVPDIPEVPQVRRAVQASVKEAASTTVQMPVKEVSTAVTVQPVVEPEVEAAGNIVPAKDEPVVRIDVDASGKAEECELPGNPEDIFPEENESRGARRRKASVRLAFSNGSPYCTVQSGYGAMNSSAVSYQISNSSSLTTPGLSSVLLRNNEKEISTSTTHCQPLKFELLAGVEVLKNFSVVSGVSYSCMISDLTSGTDANNYETRQTLHYIGIPLSLNYNIPLSEKLGLYLALGGRIEQNIYGTSSTAFKSESRIYERQSSNLTEKVPQWSAFAGLGLQWRLSGSMNLFAEPSVSYFFPNGSHVENIYKERPLNFTLSLGVKFDL